VWEGFMYLRTTSIDDSYLFPCVRIYTDKISKLYQSLFDLIVLLTLNTIIIYGFHVTLFSFTC